MLHARQKLGDFGEVAAMRHLLQHGYRLIERQWRCRLGEIDLVLYDQQELVFVEVRSCRAPGIPFESIGLPKQRRLVRLAQQYLLDHSIPETTTWRIDVVGVQVGHSGRIVQLDHLPYAITAPSEDAYEA